MLCYAMPKAFQAWLGNNLYASPTTGASGGGAGQEGHRWTPSHQPSCCDSQVCRSHQVRLLPEALGVTQKPRGQQAGGGTGMRKDRMKGLLVEFFLRGRPEETWQRPHLLRKRPEDLPPPSSGGFSQRNPAVAGMAYLKSLSSLGVPHG